MKNVTITLDEHVARWARLRAAELDTSVSRLVGDLLADLMRRERSYEAACRTYIAAELRPLSAGDRPYPRREELHDRPGLR